jgi:hypothetical protein
VSSFLESCQLNAHVKIKKKILKGIFYEVVFVIFPELVALVMFPVLDMLVVDIFAEPAVGLGLGALLPAWYCCP